MSETRCWLVERDYWDKNLVTLVYATADGKYQHTQQRSTQMLRQKPTTAAVDVADDDLEPVPEEDRERYAEEARRTAERHDPGDEV